MWTVPASLIADMVEAGSGEESAENGIVGII
jgi:hypothetical protein